MDINYLVTDASGYTLTEGVSESEIGRVAQALANDKGEAVTVTPYHLKAGTERVDHDADAYDVAPV